MKNSKKLLSLIACLSLLSSCNGDRIGKRYCPINPDISTPTPEPTPSETVEELNKELFENYAIINSSNSLIGFKDNIPDEYLNLETIIVPENINDKTITGLQSTTTSPFERFTKIRIIKLPSTILNIICGWGEDEISSPFYKLEHLENIEVDLDNKWYYSKGNCLIRRNWKFDTDGNRVPNNRYELLCGWGDVEIPEEITDILSYRLANDSSITSIKFNSNLSSSNVSTDAFRYLDNLNKIDLNGNTNFKLEGNVLYSNNNIYGAYDEVEIPSSLSSFSLYAYTSISSVKLHASVNNFSPNCFVKLPKLSKIDLNGNTKCSLEGNCLYFQETIYALYNDVTIPKSITVLSIPNFLSVTSINLHDNVKSISNFDNLKIKSIYIPASVTYLQYDTFKSCKELVNIEIDPGNYYWKTKDNVVYRKSADNRFIFACGDAIIPDDLTSDFESNDYLTFAYCPSVRSLTIHNKFTYLKTTSFSKLNEDFKTLNFAGTIAEFKQRKFKYEESADFSFYDQFKKYSSITVNFYNNTGSTVDTYKMSELEN